MVVTHTTKEVTYRLLCDVGCNMARYGIFFSTICLLGINSYCNTPENGNALSVINPVAILYKQSELSKLEKDRVKFLLPVVEDQKKGQCPIPDFVPDSTAMDKSEDPGSPLVDANREIKDISTKFIINEFFKTPNKLYNFINLVYKSLEEDLNLYKKQNEFDNESIFLIFKGGNVLRLIANKIFDLLPPLARNSLQHKFAEYFQRSDADFAVYVDEKKIKAKTYDEVYSDVNALVFSSLNNIRKELKKNHQKYFDFSTIKPQAAQNIMKYYLVNKLEKEVPILNKDNDTWYKAKFEQFQFLDKHANNTPNCGYFGQYDYRFDTLGDEKIIITRLSDSTDWISNSDNRTIKWAIQIDPGKMIKFNLMRSKIYFDYTYIKDGVTKRKPIGGELIDVSIPHRSDDNLRHFFDNIDENVSIFNLSKNNHEEVALKTYSLSELADDLQYIVFRQTDRPWETGGKYIKRVHRMMFLQFVETFLKYGIGSREILEYLNHIETNIIRPLYKLYPLSNKSSHIARKSLLTALKLKDSFKYLTISNSFWLDFSNFVAQRLTTSYKEEDQERFRELLQEIRNDMEIFKAIARMNIYHVDESDIFDVDINHLF